MTAGFTRELTLKDGRTVTVRKIGAADGPGLKAFFEALSPESWGFFPAHPYTEEVIARRIERALNGEDWVYLALAADTVIGYFFLWNIGEPVPLLGIGIADAWQNGGLGQRFMAILIDDARALGKDGIELTTMRHNDRAFHVYQKMGFQYYGDVENIIADGTVIYERGLFLPLKAGAKLPQSKHACPD